MDSVLGFRHTMAQWWEHLLVGLPSVVPCVWRELDVLPICVRTVLKSQAEKRHNLLRSAFRSELGVEGEM